MGIQIGVPGKGRRKYIHVGKAFAEQPVVSLGTAEISSAKGIPG
jgi:hypothetical protein